MCSRLESSFFVVTGSETLNVARGGCIMSCLRPLTQRASSSSTDVVRSSAKPVKFWTAVMRGLLAQHEMSESLSSVLVSVLALGDVDPPRRSGLSADAAIRRMHANLAHASVPDMRRMLMAARAPQPILDALARFSCAQRDAVTAPRIPRGVDVKWLPCWDEASNLQHIYPSFETETSEVLLRTVSSMDTGLRKAPLAQS